MVKRSQRTGRVKEQPPKYEMIRIQCPRCEKRYIYVFNKPYKLKSIPIKRCADCGKTFYITNVMPEHQEYFDVAHLLSRKHHYEKIFKVFKKNLGI
jgi:transposase-like protein